MSHEQAPHTSPVAGPQFGTGELLQKQRAIVAGDYALGKDFTMPIGEAGFQDLGEVHDAAQVWVDDADIRDRRGSATERAEVTAMHDGSVLINPEAGVNVAATTEASVSPVAAPAEILPPIADTSRRGMRSRIKQAMGTAGKAVKAFKEGFSEGYNEQRAAKPAREPRKPRESIFKDTIFSSQVPEYVAARTRTVAAPNGKHASGEVAKGKLIPRHGKHEVGEPVGRHERSNNPVGRHERKRLSAVVLGAIALASSGEIAVQQAMLNQRLRAEVENN